jgi:tRNA-specific 2-thiouridylase
MPAADSPPAGTPGRVLVGMSGGVDSSVAALLLLQMGWQVEGLTLLLGSDSLQCQHDAAAVCRQLQIPWRCRDARKAFREQVVDSLVDGYLNGLTPNPCVFCNAEVKFHLLIEEADRLECQAVASGHYARIVRMPVSGRLALAEIPGNLKDQSYFMYRLTQSQLARILFPLGGMDKADVRQAAAQARLLDAAGRPLAERPDSQDTCFTEGKPYAEFISDQIGRTAKATPFLGSQPGTVVDTAGRVIGEHRGLIHYTLGQRKGFTVRTTERLFVVAKQPENNRLVVGPYPAILKRQILVAQMAYSGACELEQGEYLDARIRNQGRLLACRVYPQPDGRVRVDFTQPAAAPTPGQSCVFYRDSIILAGGVIDTADGKS